MPTYEYVCRQCGHTFSLIMSLKERDTAKITCSKCGSDDVAQQLSVFISQTSRKS